jgi:hypothetical protein
MVAATTGELPVPNRSFESPATIFVSTPIDAWQKTARPPGYNEGGGFTWEQLTGIFKNTAAGRFDHIANCDGAQALFIFAIPDAGLIQSSFPAEAGVEGGDVARFQVGKGYTLTVGVIGGGGGMAPGASLELGLHFLDAASTQVTVASTRVIHDPAVFTSITNLIDFSVAVPPVRAGDPWAGHPIGVHLIARETPPDSGGYWDLDHVRLNEIAPLRLSSPAIVEGWIEFTIESEPGLKFEVLASDSPELPAAAWVPTGFLTNETGRTVFREPLAPGSRRFYLAEQIP